MQIVTTKTSDGLSYKGLLSEPAQPGSKIIVHIHGMSGNIYYNSFYPAMHKLFPENGIAFLVGEHRGTGSITQFESSKGVQNIGNTFELFEDSRFDIQAWIDYARNLGYSEIWVSAHSLGPSKLAYYVDQTPNNGLAGLIFISPSDMIGLVHEPKELPVHQKLLAEAQALVNQGKPRQLLSGYLWGNLILSAQTYANFFGEHAKTAIFNFGQRQLGWKVVNGINLPVLAFTGTADDGIAPVIDPHAAMKLLEKELVNSPRKQTVVYAKAEHDFEGFGEQLVQDIVGFIQPN